MPDIGQNNKIVMVAGGTSGIGRSVVLRCRKQGYDVSYFGRSSAHLEETQQLLGPGAGALGGQVDVRDPAELAGFVRETTERLGPVSRLVYATGISPKKDGRRVPVHEIGQSEWDDVFSVNLTGAFRCCQAVLPSMISQGFGRIVLIGSSAARFTPRFAGASYVASKAALSGLARSIAVEYAKFGITANVVSPGNVATEMTGGALSDQNKAAVHNIPAGYVAQPDDLAGIVEFLCRAESHFINGAIIDATGAEYVGP